MKILYLAFSILLASVSVGNAEAGLLACVDPSVVGRAAIALEANDFDTAKAVLNTGIKDGVCGPVPQELSEPEHPVKTYGKFQVFSFEVSGTTLFAIKLLTQS